MPSRADKTGRHSKATACGSIERGDVYCDRLKSAHRHGSWGGPFALVIPTGLVPVEFGLTTMRRPDGPTTLPHPPAAEVGEKVSVGTVVVSKPLLHRDKPGGDLSGSPRSVTVRKNAFVMQFVGQRASTHPTSLVDSFIQRYDAALWSSTIHFRVKRILRKRPATPES